MSPRMSAEDRREQVIREAVTVFARHGYEGATTAQIAERVGVSQPYLFRLFPTKKDLFLAASERNMQDTMRLMREAAGGKTGYDALGEMGHAYQEMLQTNREWLLMQLQSFAACYDEDVQRQTRHCLQNIWNLIDELTGLPIEPRVTFVAMGMFCNVIAAAGRLDGFDDQWAPILEAMHRQKYEYFEQAAAAETAAKTGSPEPFSTQAFSTQAFSTQPSSAQTSPADEAPAAGTTPAGIQATGPSTAKTPVAVDSTA
jgi:AcrR family transcriptional regulator